MRNGGKGAGRGGCFQFLDRPNGWRILLLVFFTMAILDWMRQPAVLVPPQVLKMAGAVIGPAALLSGNVRSFG